MAQKIYAIIILLPCLLFAQTVQDIGTTCDGTCSYSSITNWEAQNADATAVSGGYRGEAYNDATFDEAVSIVGWTTDATHPLEITVISGERHNGTAGTGARWASSTNRTVQPHESYLYVSWFEMGTSGGNGSPAVAHTSTAEAGTPKYFRHILFANVVGDETARTLSAPSSATTVQYENCFFIRTTDAFHVFECTQASWTFDLYNITIRAAVTTSVGVRRTNGTVNCTNVASFTPTCFSGTIGGTNNASSDATAPGANSLINLTIANQITSDTNLHIKAGADISGAGTNTTSSMTDDFDIDNEAWPAAGAINMGADHVVAAGGAQFDPGRKPQVL